MDAKKAVKALAATALDKAGVRAAVGIARRRAAGGRRVVVVGYHRVCRDFEAERRRGIETCLISRDTFREHVEFLATHFEIATMSRAVEVLSRRARAMRDLAVITFDDGYADVLQNALPILREYGAPATMYVSSGVVANRGHFPHDRLYALLMAYERSQTMRSRTSPESREIVAKVQTKDGGNAKSWLHGLIRDESPAVLEHLCQELAKAADVAARPPDSALALDWDGVRALADGGVEIGAHTVSHCVLTHLDQASVEAELRESREAIERAIHRPVRHFAYCNGYYNETVIRALVRSGYQSAVTTEDRLNRLGDDPFIVGRRILWEKSAAGASGRTHPSLLACQLDDTWSALGMNASEVGRKPEPLPVATPAEERRLA